MVYKQGQQSNPKQPVGSVFLAKEYWLEYLSYETEVLTIGLEPIT